jgi:signal transduction histidine kinase
MFALAGIPLGFLAGLLFARRSIAGKPVSTPLEYSGRAATDDASLRELAESRARIQVAADTERRRIERDLHDGIQQRLIALGIRIGLAEDTLRGDARAAALLSELGSKTDEALEEVRSLAQGVYPSLLVDEGLVETLRALARGASIPTTVVDGGIGRYPPEIENAVYFCCLEALQNAAKHARGASSVTITVARNDVLWFEVRDDGTGFEVADVTPGRGISSMRDRVGAAGGRLAVHSEARRGTRVVGMIVPHELGPGEADNSVGARCVAPIDPVDAMSSRAGLAAP